jgi:KaiC/GvpD/RAD55 family RecA-like ATPase
VLYVSLEQNRASLIRQMRGMGLTDPPASSWGLVDVATIGKESGEASRSVWMDLFWRVLRSRRRLQPYEILALDSLDALELIARYPSGRDETFGLFDALRQDGVTSLVVSESTENGGVSRGRERLGAAYLADGVISLTMEPRLEGPLQRRVRVVKMRGTAHETRFFPFAFESGAFALSEPPGG